MEEVGNKNERIEKEVKRTRNKEVPNGLPKMY